MGGGQPQDPDRLPPRRHPQPVRWVRGPRRAGLGRYRRQYDDISRLDRILEGEGDTTNAYKVSKQADVLMLLYLLSAEELDGVLERLGYDIDPEVVPRTIGYYLARTCHGSTLSRVVHAWVLARSDREVSWHLFEEALQGDLNDAQRGTTAEGIHLGAMAGTVDLLFRCYLGIHTGGGVLWFDPHLPAEIGRMELSLQYRSQRMDLTVTGRELTVEAGHGSRHSVRVGSGDEIVELHPGDQWYLELEPARPEVAYDREACDPSAVAIRPVRLLRCWGFRRTGRRPTDRPRDRSFGLGGPLEVRHRAPSGGERLVPHPHRHPGPDGYCSASVACGSGCPKITSPVMGRTTAVRSATVFTSRSSTASSPTNRPASTNGRRRRHAARTGARPAWGRVGVQHHGVDGHHTVNPGIVGKAPRREPDDQVPIGHDPDGPFPIDHHHRPDTLSSITRATSWTGVWGPTETGSFRARCLTCMATPFCTPRPRWACTARTRWAADRRGGTTDPLSMVDRRPGTG